MKNRLKSALIIVFAFTIIFANSIIVFADDTYTYTVEYSMSNGTRFRYTFTTTLGNCVLVKDSVRYGQYAYGYVNGEAVNITGSSYLVGNMVGYVDREGNGNFTYLRETTEISFPYSYEVTGIDVYETIDEYVSHIRANEPEEPPTEEPTEPEEPPTINIDDNKYVTDFFVNEFVYYVSFGFIFAFAISFLMVLVCYVFRNLLEIVKNV